VGWLSISGGTITEMNEIEELFNNWETIWKGSLF
jgi:hypothetical protein